MEIYFVRVVNICSPYRKFPQNGENGRLLSTRTYRYNDIVVICTFLSYFVFFFPVLGRQKSWRGIFCGARQNFTYFICMRPGLTQQCQTDTHFWRSRRLPNLNHISTYRQNFHSQNKMGVYNKHYFLVILRKNPEKGVKGF